MRRFARHGRGEQRILVGGVSWDQYKEQQAFYERLGGARVTFLDGLLEILTLSRDHENKKHGVSFLFDCYLVEKEMEFFPYGSATLEKKLKLAGKEPDESYCFHSEKPYPDLVIEIAITTGGIDTLEIYRRYGIPEVWIWQRNRLRVYHLLDGAYAAATTCFHFPDLDLRLLEECAQMKSLVQARKRWLAGCK
jgi:Uma2 family endonuclease